MERIDQVADVVGRVDEVQVLAATVTGKRISLRSLRMERQTSVLGRGSCPRCVIDAASDE